MAVKRTYYRDKCSSNKAWEVVKLNGGYCLRQYICGKQIEKEVRITKECILRIGILGFEVNERIEENRT